MLYDVESGCFMMCIYRFLLLPIIGLILLAINEYNMRGRLTIILIYPGYITIVNRNVHSINVEVLHTFYSNPQF